MKYIIALDNALNTISEQESSIAALKSKVAALQEMMTHVYNSGYHAGHHDTVEGLYVDIHPSDMDTYHKEEVGELISELRKTILPDH